MAWRRSSAPTVGPTISVPSILNAGRPAAWSICCDLGHVGREAGALLGLRRLRQANEQLIRARLAVTLHLVRQRLQRSANLIFRQRGR